MKNEIITQIEQKTEELKKAHKIKSELEVKACNLELEHLQKKRDFILNPEKYLNGQPVGKTADIRDAQRRQWMNDHYEADHLNKVDMINNINLINTLGAELRLLYVKLDAISN